MIQQLSIVKQPIKGTAGSRLKYPQDNGRS